MILHMSIMQIIIKFSNGSQLKVEELHTDMTIDELKRKILQLDPSIKNDASKHRMIFNGEELMNDSTLFNCQIQDNSIIFMNLGYRPMSRSEYTGNLRFPYPPLEIAISHTTYQT
jgi:hypothetical protein